MPPTTKTLSPAELAKLEHAFATDPASEAYKPLAEAYLGMGRFMEAMVVCKKGVKAHPQLPDPRVLLARVYAEQGKDKKAVEELNGALQVAPSDKLALRLMGTLQMRNGEPEAGKANLLKAFEADPADAETLEAMQKAGVPVPKPAAPEPPPPPPQPVQVAAPPVLHQTPGNGVAPAQQGSSPRLQPVAQHAEPPPQPRASRPAPPPQARPQARPAARRSYEEDDDEEPISELSEVSDPGYRKRKKKKSGASKAVFFLLIFAVPVAAAAYYGVGQWKARQVKEANGKLREATDKIKADTYAGYQQGIELADQALTIDGSADTNRLARGLLAYAYTVRWGEHQRDESNREAAEKHIREGIEGKESSAYLRAADALFKYYSGKNDEALSTIEEWIKAAEAEKKQVGLYYLTRGIIQMNSGDLEAAKESLDRAQTITPDDPRVFVALGNLHRRRGSDMQALTAFNNALKYTRNSHPDGLLGTAKLILDQPDPAAGYITAAKYLKTLLEMEPPPSPRQLAQAHFVKAILVSRLSTDLTLYTDKDFVKKLETETGITSDAGKARSEIQKEENEGLALDRNNPELLMLRGRRLAYENRLDDAAAEIRKAIEMNNSASHFHVELAKVLMRKEGGEPAAEEALKKALSLVPGSPKLLAMLGQAQYRQRKFDEAKGTLEKAVSDSKTRNPEARYLLGKILRDEKKDYARAAELFDKAAQEYFQDPTQSAASYDELGVTWELKGDKDKARTSYEKALNADKDYPMAYCHYARFLSKLSDAKEKEKAKALAAEFLKQAPRDACADDMKAISGG
ncbi:MAG: tetratricopeptide repeat protein [Myxococcota bacterium]